MDERIFAVHHVTEYVYSARVELAHHIAHLVPVSQERQQLQESRLTIDPPPSDQDSGRDCFGNVRSTFSLYSPHERLRVEATSRLRLCSSAICLDPEASPRWESVREALGYRAGGPYLAASEFRFASPYVPHASELADYALASFTPGRALVPAAIDLMHRVHADFRYCTQSTDVSTPLLEAFRARAGVCQDFSHVMLGCLRSIGLGGRYISGYLITHDDADRPPPLGVGASHAWISVYCPVTGWVDLDATNDTVPAASEQASHITVAVGRDYGDVTPLRGVIRGGGRHTLEVAVRVSPIS